MDILIQHHKGQYVILLNGKPIGPTLTSRDDAIKIGKWFKKAGALLVIENPISQKDIKPKILDSLTILKDAIASCGDHDRDILNAGYLSACLIEYLNQSTIQITKKEYYGQ